MKKSIMQKIGSIDRKTSQSLSITKWMNTRNDMIKEQPVVEENNTRKEDLTTRVQLSSINH